MIGRVTSQLTANIARENLQANLARLNALTEMATSQRRISVPSDDPVGTGQAMRARSELRAAEQHVRNADNGIGWLSTVDSAVRSAVDILGRVQDLALQGANGSTNQQGRDAIAEEIESLRTAMLTQANTTYDGRTVFAGTSDAGVAFQSDGTYTGAAGGTVERRVGPTETIRVDADGAAVFGTGSGSVFALLDDVAATLRSSGDLSASLAGIDDRRQAMLAELTTYGSRQARLESAKSETATRVLGLEARRSEVEDVDMARLIIDLKSQEVAYQGALGVTSRVLSSSLMDFVR